MQFPITIGLHRSHFMAWLLVFGLALAGAAVLSPPWSAGTKAALLVGVMCSGIWAWLRLRLEVDGLRLLDDGRLECRLVGASGFLLAELLPGAVAHPWLTVIRVKVAGRKLWVVVPPDVIGADDFRRLRIWLRWRAGFSVAESAF